MTLMAMSAHAVGVRPLTYARTRTFSELAVDGKALVAKWAWPATVLMSALNGGKSDGNSTGPAPVRGGTVTAKTLPSHFKRKSGWNYNVLDLGPIEGEAEHPLGSKWAGRRVDKEAMDYAASLLVGSSGLTRVNTQPSAVFLKA